MILEMYGSTNVRRITAETILVLLTSAFGFVVVKSLFTL